MPLSYRGKAGRLLREAGAEDYSTLLVEKERAEFRGMLIPRAELLDDEHVILKLDSGYNVGISVDEIKGIRVLEGPRAVEGVSLEERPERAELPNVPIVVTGGTIASKVDYVTGGVTPYERPEELIDLIPEISEIANVSYVPLMSMLSEDLQPTHWIQMAREVAKQLNSGAAGVVLPHGTDVMHFTSAALSFVLRGLSKPVVLVGAQRSIDRPSTDAVLNLFSAVKMAAQGPIGEVMIVMHGSPSDEFACAIRGTRARKMHTSRRDAFMSINEPPLARVSRSGIEITNERYKKREEGEVEVFEDLEARIALIHSWPTIGPEVFDSLIEDGYVGLVVAGTGLGHLPRRMVPKVSELTSNGIPVVVTSQCLSGRVDLKVYENGRYLLDAGAIPAGDMLPEVALVKLMYAMGQTRELSEVSRIMGENLAGELGESVSVTSYPPRERW